MGCGKSTRVNSLLRDKSWRRVSRDFIRESIGGEFYSMDIKDENIVTKIEMEQYRNLLLKGFNVVIDNMNIDPRFLAPYFKIAREVERGRNIKFTFEYEDYTNISLKEVLANNVKRNTTLPNNHYKICTPALVKAKYKDMLNSSAKWYDTWAKLLLNKENNNYVVQDESLPKAIIFDIDGTLALMNGKRSPYDWHKVDIDDLNEPVFEAYKAFKENGFKIVICTGRDGECEELTKEWLEFFGITYDDFYMRTPNDMRKDSIVKMEFLDEILNKFYVSFVMDDRTQVVDMWRGVGLSCFQVADGNF